MSYAVTPTLSVEAFHDRDTLEEVLPVEVRFVGAVGAWVSSRLRRPDRQADVVGVVGALRVPAVDVDLWRWSARRRW